MSTAASTAELRTFRLHPSILLTIMEEQAGSLFKALAELIMNSVDAGATAIHISLDVNGFTITDDGQGFSSRNQIEEFFEMFGAPHVEGDALFGRFRIGRGQIMSYAKTTWRSGPFEMAVDIRGAVTENNGISYKLSTHSRAQEGCYIKGTFYKKLYSVDQVEYDLQESVRYVSIPVFLNQKQITAPPEQEAWTMEDENAWYFFDNNFRGMTFYNLGVLVAEHNENFYGASGIVVSKKPFRVNMARNAILIDKCELWAAIKTTIDERFMLRIRTEGMNLGTEERRKLIRFLLYDSEQLSPADRSRIQVLRFIKNIHGEFCTPDEFFVHTNYTLFDGRHPMVAERVEQQKRACVVDKEMFEQIHVKKGASDFFDNIFFIRGAIYPHKQDDLMQWIPFESFVEEMKDTCKILDDKDLAPEELLTLNVLRKMDRFGQLVRRDEGQALRPLVAGDSDCMNAWTDGLSYVAIDRSQLTALRKGCGVAGLVLLVTHEYCHDERSVGDHPHDFNFYKRFHDRAMSVYTDHRINLMFRKYLSAMCKARIILSSDTGYHVRAIVKYAPKLRGRKRMGVIDSGE